MTEADRAYAAAEARIAATLEYGHDTLDLNAPQFRELAILPPTISERVALRKVDLDCTKLTDLAPLQRLNGIEHLFLERVPVRDLAPLSGLTRLTRLTLGHSHAEDITPLHGLTALMLLTLQGTDVADLTPLAAATQLSSLSIEDTKVADLTPLLGLPQLWNGSGVLGLAFAGCAAARNDSQLAAIAQIPDKAGRAQALQRYLDAAK